VIKRACLLLLLASVLVAPGVAAGQANQSAIIRYPALHHPVLDRDGMVASQNAIASEVGARILADGGNAVDAAVGVGFALAVTLPRAGNIGGGGFMLFFDATSNSGVAIDYRETAPPGASRDMFLDADGNVDERLARFSHLSSGVPGTVAGLYEAHRRYGSLPWKRLVEPAERLARDGIAVSYDMAENLRNYRDRLSRSDTSRSYFFRPDGSPHEPGDRLVQRDLAKSLRLIAKNGADAFYRGAIAKMIAAEMEANGGLVDLAALDAYRPVLREALAGSYRGHDVIAMPPSSSGGAHVLQMLNVLEHFPVADMGYGSADYLHLLAETFKLAYADRSQHLGDMDFYDVPLGWLTDKAYGRELAERIDMTRARPSAEVAPGVAPLPESVDTTHFSIIDRHGNAVANTFTLNFSYGSGISVAGAGFLLNNEMDDFSAKPGVPNAFGLIGGEANAIEAGKRPLSSMTPTIVLRDGRPWLVTGSPGGSQIITSVMQMIVNVVDHGMNIADATHAPRLHHQWLPDELLLESGFSPDTIRLLEGRGHRIVPSEGMGSLQTVGYFEDLYRGASDPRRPQAGSAGPAMLRSPM